MLNLKTLYVSSQYYVVFDYKFTTVPYMQSGEVSPHWADLVANSSKSATDSNIDVANTWAAEDFTCEGDQNNIDPNLALTCSFKTQPLSNY